MYAYVFASPTDTNEGTVSVVGQTLRCRAHAESPIRHETRLDGFFLDDGDSENIFNQTLLPLLKESWDGEDVTMIFRNRPPPDSGLVLPKMSKHIFESLWTEGARRSIPHVYDVTFFATAVTVCESSIEDVLAECSLDKFVGNSFGEKSAQQHNSIVVPPIVHEPNAANFRANESVLSFRSDESSGARKIRISEVPKNSNRFAVKNISVVKLHSTSNVQELLNCILKHQEESKNEEASLIVSFHVSQTCKFAAHKSSRIQLIFFGREENPFLQEMLRGTATRQVPAQIPGMKNFLDMNLNKLIFACTMNKKTSHIALCERVVHENALESLNVLAAAKGAIVGTVLDRATEDVVQISGDFEIQRHAFGQHVTTLKEELAELEDKLQGVEARITTFHNSPTITSDEVAGRRPSFFQRQPSLIRRPSLTRNDDSTLSTPCSSARQGGLFDEERVLDEILRVEEDIQIHETYAEAEREELGLRVQDAEAQWKQVSNEAMELRQRIDELRTEIGNREYSSHCATVAAEKSFQQELDLLQTDHHNAASYSSFARRVSLEVSRQQPQPIAKAVAMKQRKSLVKPSSGFFSRNLQNSSVSQISPVKKSVSFNKSSILDEVTSPTTDIRKAVAKNKQSATSSHVALLVHRKEEAEERIAEEKEACRVLRQQIDQERHNSAKIIQQYNVWMGGLMEFTLRTMDVLDCYKANTSVNNHFHEWLEYPVLKPAEPRLLVRCRKQAENALHNSLSTKTVSISPESPRFLQFLRYKSTSLPAKPTMVDASEQNEEWIPLPVHHSPTPWVRPSSNRGKLFREQLSKFRSLTPEIS